jgi:hypothetical protein
VLATASVPEELHPLYARLLGILEGTQSQQAVHQQQQQQQQEEVPELSQDPPDPEAAAGVAAPHPVQGPVLAAQMAGLAAQLMRAAFKQHAAIAAAGLLGRDPPEPLADYTGQVRGCSFLLPPQCSISLVALPALVCQLM